MSIMIDYSRQVISTYELHQDPYNAAYMTKYMKNKFSFYGIKSPVRKDISKPFLARNVLPPITDIPTIIRTFWNQTGRELQYFALDLLSKYYKKGPVDWIDLFEALITTKSWWDSVDGLASNQVGAHFKNFPELIDPYTNKWMASNNMWLQRTCLLFQLKYKDNTDFALLKSFIEPLVDSDEFFIRKAIGWSLRQYGKFSSEDVVDYVAVQPMSNLSKKEALRLINS